MTYNEHDVKTRAVSTFISLISQYDAELGEQLTNNHSGIYTHLLTRIQKDGVHDYARQVLNQGSTARKQLNEALIAEELDDEVNI